jgi:hypothetical protein
VPVVCCARCGARLSAALEPAEPEVIDLTVSGRATVPPGVCIVDPSPRSVEVSTRRTDGGWDTSTVEQAPAGSIVIHPDDRLDGAIEVVGRANGCCALDGHDGPNQGCRCGAVLGTAWTDCWTANEIRFLPDAVALVDDRNFFRGR